MERSAWPKSLSSSGKRAIQELCGQNPKKLRDAFDAHSQTGDDPQQPLFAGDLIVSVLGSFSSNTQSLSSGAESYEVSQVPSNACVMSGVSKGSESIESPVRRLQRSPVESVDEAEPTEARIQRRISEQPVIILSRSFCCICQVMKRLLGTLNVHPTIIELDDDEICSLGDGASTPSAFISGSPIGGLESLTALHLSGRLMPMLIAVGSLDY